ncbi:asparagine synthase (glutamine-hydrolyzing) [bacterium]|nr:asparagine synthase (glutamine-hydrolyzing) [bacterium]
MCGITGIFNFGMPVEESEIRGFTSSLNHRGPDGSDVMIDGDLALGHTRLAILDLSEQGKCPMPYTAPDGTTYWITFNGEIYNFIEIRDRLKDAGYQFRTQTDTEVIVAAYIHWGENCLLEFNGMWAFAIWNSRSRELFLARDRFGIKPLYFEVSSRFTFASELKAFRHLQNFTTKLNDQMAGIALTQNVSFEGNYSETLLQNVHRLRAGHYLKIGTNGKIEISQWWNTADHIIQIEDSYEDQVQMFKELFFDSVRLRLRSDVPVGTCLSGGIDSSSVACTIAEIQQQSGTCERRQSDWQRTSIATFPGTMVDERKYADQVVKHIGASPQYWIFDPDEAVNYVVESVWAMDDLSGAIAVPVWGVYRNLRQHGSVVSLDGHGGDELLAGYAWQLDYRSSELNSHLYREFHHDILPGILRNYDRCSMAHGVEVRMPFMDWRLVTYAFSLPFSSKLGGGLTKRILRDAMKGILPEGIRTRRSKIGFNSPMIEWFNGGLRNLILELVHHPLWLQCPHFDGPTLGKQIAEKTRNAAWIQKDWGLSLEVWTRLSFVLWQLMFIENERPHSLQQEVSQ